ncbi:hypothetical protein BH10ACI2_BH10ACI2_21080 [soil metagenome]
MSEKKTGQPGDTVELADKDGGFTDPTTGFDISRDQKVVLGDSVGERTQQAIMSGGLLLVGSGKKAKAKTEVETEAETEEETEVVGDEAPKGKGK